MSKGGRPILRMERVLDENGIKTLITAFFTEGF